MLLCFVLFFLKTENSNLLVYPHSSTCTPVTTPNYEISPGSNTYSQARESNSDRHHTSSAIPVPKRQSSIFGGADEGFSGVIPSPDKGHRKRASSENERLQYKTPPPSYNSASAQPVTTIPPMGESEGKVASLSSSLDTSLDFSKENKKKGVDLGDSLNEGHVSVGTSQEQGAALPGPPATANGALLPSEQASSSGVQLPGEFPPVSEAELCCTVEQAEEIIGMEATGFTSGDQLEAFNCTPVDSAVAVECDEQVLGEFEEFSRRIYALNENSRAPALALTRVRCRPAQGALIPESSMHRRSDCAQNCPAKVTDTLPADDRELLILLPHGNLVLQPQAKFTGLCGLDSPKCSAFLPRGSQVCTAGFLLPVSSMSRVPDDRNEPAPDPTGRVGDMAVQLSTWY
ncbi:UV radiation resistance-associated gene protein [Galemys pyrenaicus]|uniref:UV radiation resistance-associated gene protein n=1 Tax=Galemys pyrenaicus TaxID=202257 RepID=A0A8J6AK32_GALPY|nr:UV radiation resistance-associated gene protein [Galemys pyrenaicus]